MTRSRVIILIAVCILAALSIPLKVERFRSLAQVDRSREIRLVSLLTSHHFETDVEPLPDDRVLIHARRDVCTMDLREVAPSGFDRSAMEVLATGRRLFYVADGVPSATQPVWRTWIYFHFRRFASFFGWSISKHPTFAVAEDTSCGDLDWNELAMTANAVGLG